MSETSELFASIRKIVPTCGHCGEPWPLDDAGKLLEEAIGICPWGRCEEMYCRRCGRYQGGFGGVDCWCDPERGHRTKAEAPRRTTVRVLNRYRRRGKVRH